MWEDNSTPLSALQHLNAFSSVRLDNQINVFYTPDAMMRKEDAFEMLRDRHSQRLRTRKIRRQLTIAGGVDEKVLVYNPELAAPWYAKRSVYILMEIFLLGWIQRILINKNLIEVTFEINKTLLD